MRKIFLIAVLGFIFIGCGTKEEAKKSMKMEHKTMKMAASCNEQCCTKDPQCIKDSCWNDAGDKCIMASCGMMRKM